MYAGANAGIERVSFDAFHTSMKQPTTVATISGRILAIIELLS